MIRRLLLAAALAPSLLLIPVTAAAQGTPAAPAARQQPTGPYTQRWNIDRSHSEMTFSIRHIVSRVRGTFRQWEGAITIPDPVNWERGSSIDVSIQTASIFTDHERRDAHLRTSDFFLADSFPTITFRSTRIERSGDDARIHGNLTMRGVTRPVVITGEFLGTQGAEFQRVGFEGSTKLNRLDYGVAWNRAVEGGGVTLGDEVTITLSIAATRSRATQ
ncbi:MAG: YceI family protein [Gemmatimonadaceae bacterium]|nr:YceI family protein [Gemmatimonadaceae bacterium]